MRHLVEEEIIMKKRFLCAALASVMAFSLTACSGGENVSAAASTETKTEGSEAASDTAAQKENDAEDAKAEGGTLVVGFDQDFPPMGFLGDDGEYTGFDLELAQETARRLGLEYKAQPIAWDAKDMELESGNIDCIWNGFTMEGREDDYTFSEPYMLNEQVLVVKKDAGIKSWDDLAGKTVITQTDSAAQDVLEGDQKDLAETFATLDTIGEYNTAFMQLESGAVDAVACDLSIAQYQLAAKPDAYTQLDEPLSSEHYAVGFKQGDTKSADAVTESLKALYEDGTVKDLCDKYASYGLSFDNWVLK